MRRYVPLLLVALVLVVDGYVHGIWTDRWRPSQEVQAAADRLQQVPMSFGDWEGFERAPLSEREVAQAGFAGYVMRTYRNQRTGAAVNVLLACGRSGPLAVHTPDVCYRGAGFLMITPQEQHKDKHGDFWQAQFGKPDSSEPAQLRILWSWNSDGTWQAPDNPRLTFPGGRPLYKLFLIHEMLPDDASADTVVREFIADMLPALRTSLFPKS
jgi:hypothetical protein